VSEIACNREVVGLVFSFRAEMALIRAIIPGYPVTSGRLVVGCVPFFDNFIIWKGYVGGALASFA
jgi:hypothetical protein